MSTHEEDEEEGEALPLSLHFDGVVSRMRRARQILDCYPSEQMVELRRRLDEGVQKLEAWHGRLVDEGTVEWDEETPADVLDRMEGKAQHIIQHGLVVIDYYLFRLENEGEENRVVYAAKGTAERLYGEIEAMIKRGRQVAATSQSSRPESPAGKGQSAGQESQEGKDVQ